LAAKQQSVGQQRDAGRQRDTTGDEPHWRRHRARPPASYTGLGTWRRDAAFSTWLFALATNVYRSELRRAPPISVSIEAAGTALNGADLTGDSRGNSRDQIVRDAVRSLPARYRDVLTLFYFHEMDVAKTARSLGLPEGTIKARLSRGRGLLRDKLMVLLAGLG
jgi:RNA polymerase sigma-70 factor (ECF subfamily)